jgi:electron transfer flavoprotein alpha subunit
MAKVLIIAEHDGGRLNAATGKCIRCARDLSPEAIDVAVFAADGADLCAQAARLSGATRVLRIDGPDNVPALAARLAPQVAALAAGYTHVLGPSTTFGKDLMPRIAALIGVGQVSDIMAVEGRYRFKRPVYAGNAVLTVEADESALVVATVRAASYAAVESADEPAPVEAVNVDVATPTHTRFIALEAGQRDRPDLQSASRVVSGGRGLGSREQFALIEQLADALGAAVGASRAAVDAGFVPNEMQVGQTGKIIAPELYVAVGISGAIQHLTGIKDARTIVAINRDADAPIFEIADIGLVADLFEVVPQLVEALESYQAGR